MTKPFSTIHRNDSCNLGNTSLFLPNFRTIERTFCSFYFLQFAFQYPDLLDPTLSINPLFLSTATVLSMDVLLRWQTTASSFFVIFGLFLISANTLVCESLSPCSSVLLPTLLPTLSPTSLMKLNGMVTVMSLSEKSNAPSPYSDEITGIPLPVFSLICSCKKISDSFSFTGTECPRKKPALV